MDGGFFSVLSDFIVYNNPARLVGDSTCFANLAHFDFEQFSFSVGFSCPVDFQF